MINLRSRAAKLRSAQQAHRVMDLLERSMRNALAAEFNRAARDAGASYPNMDGVYSRHEKNVQNIMLNNYTKVTEAFAKRARDQVQTALGKTEKKALQTEDQLMDDLRSWSKKRAFSKVSSDISKRTKNKMRSAIADGLAAAENPSSIARMLREAVSSLSVSRAQTIARTETHVAAMTAEFEAVSGEAEELGLTKEWVATSDDRTRDAHAQVDGTVLPMDEDFTVDGETMAHPGDSGASAANVINCRCVLVYGVK